MISSSSGLTPSELISIARALAVLAEHVKLPDAPYFIWGNNIDQAALAEALSASAYTKELFAEGILFVPEIYEDIGGNGYIHRLSIEGIGSTPLKAKMNSLAGGFRTEMHDLSEEVDRFFLKESLFPATGGKRLMNREVGFFMRRKNNGEWYVAKSYVKIDMSKLRNAAEVKYISDCYLSNNKYRDNLESARASQEYFYNMFDQYRELFRAKVKEAIMSSILELRRGAIEDLRKSQEYAEEAQKWSKVAQGISLVTNILSIGGAAASISASEAQRTALEQSSRAISAANNAVLDLQDQINLINDHTGKINAVFILVSPNIPLPDARLH